MSARPHPLAVLIVTGAMVLAAAAALPDIASARSAGTALSGAISTPAQVSNGSASRIGPAPSGQHLRVVLGLRAPHPARQAAFVASLKDRSSPNFRHFITPAQWAARFSPTPASERTVVGWAHAQELTVARRYPDRLIVDLDTTVGRAERAFGVTISNYRMAGRTYYSNDRSVSLPSRIAGIVQSVEGLDDLDVLTSAASPSQNFPAYSPGPERRTGPSVHANGSRVLLRKAIAASRRSHDDRGPDITNNAYDPTDLYSDYAYSVNALDAMGHCCNPNNISGGSPPAESIAIAAAGTESDSDLTGFHNQYPYLATHASHVYIDGTPTCCVEEGTLDLEWATAMSNSFGSYLDTAHVYMYDGVNSNQGTFTDNFNTIYTDDKTRVMSTSWGDAELYKYGASVMNTDHNVFDAMLGSGWTLFGAGGDQGAYANCAQVSVVYPASDPDVLSSGGTSLQASTTGWMSENAWTGGSTAGSCTNNNGGGGGGCSQQWSQPGYQNGNVNGLCGMRTVPDFSLNANIGQNVYYNGSLTRTGGTSIVAPELAGIWAQINAYLATFPSSACPGRCDTVGEAGPDVYASSEGGRHDPFYDITSGCTSNDVGSGWCAGTGYDLATGLGSADLYQLATGVLYWNTIEKAAPTVTISGPGSGYQRSGTISWSVTDNGTSSGSPTGVAGYTAQWDSDPGDPSTEPHGGSGNYFWDGPAMKNSSSGSVPVSSSGEGCHTLYVRAWDNVGNSSLSTYRNCYDGTVPTFTSNPSTSLATGTVTAGTLPITTSWAATDALSGIKNYNVYRSDNGGSYNFVATVASPSITENLSVGHSHQYLVYAVDNAGNSSPASTNVFTPRVAQETAQSITYSTGWTSATVSGASGGKVKYATAHGKTAAFTFTGGRYGFMTTLGPNRGAATISLDGGSATTVGTHAGATQPAQLVYAANVKNTQHTVKVTVSGTSGHPRVDVDAFVYITIAPAG